MRREIVKNKLKLSNNKKKGKEKLEQFLIIK
jgi:hypothetical protein